MYGSISVNISNFNISFNAGKGPINSSKTRSGSGAVLPPRKAVELPSNARNSEDNSKNSSVPNQTKNISGSSSTTRMIQKESAILLSSPTPRSSSLYQPESDEENTEHEEPEVVEYSEVDEDIETGDDQNSTTQTESDEEIVEEESEIEEAGE